LYEGDGAIVVRGDAHVVRTVSSGRIINFFDLLKTHQGRTDGMIRFGGSGVLTSMLCGGAAFETGVHNPLVSILPPVIHVTRRSDGKDWLVPTVEQIFAELDQGASGSRDVINRLTDILFIRAVTAYFDQHKETAESGWLAAVRDEQIGRALLMLHEQPQEGWRVESAGAPYSPFPICLRGAFPGTGWRVPPTLPHSYTHQRSGYPSAHE
jgi:hypothetical protein